MPVCRLLIAVLALVALAGAPAHAQDRETISQYSTLEALIEGLYDGTMTVGEMAAYGDLGLGTYNALDGEMIVIDGQFWRARHDGTVDVVPPETETPFVAVTFFDDDLIFPVSAGLDIAGLGEVMTGHVENTNSPVAVRIDGTFSSLTYRAPAKQTAPYPPLADALKDQAVWTAEDIDATLVGFWFPAWLGNINVPAWHLHFVSADGSRGGHVLDLQTGKALVALDYASGVAILLPEGEGFADLDLATP